MTLTTYWAIQRLSQDYLHKEVCAYLLAQTQDARS